MMTLLRNMFRNKAPWLTRKLMIERGDNISSFDQDLDDVSDIDATSAIDFEDHPKKTPSFAGKVMGEDLRTIKQPDQPNVKEAPKDPEPKQTSEAQTDAPMAVLPAEDWPNTIAYANMATVGEQIRQKRKQVKALHNEWLSLHAMVKPNLTDPTLDDHE